MVPPLTVATDSVSSVSWPGCALVIPSVTAHCTPGTPAVALLRYVKTKVICKHHDRYGNVAWVLQWMKNEISFKDQLKMILFLCYVPWYAVLVFT